MACGYDPVPVTNINLCRYAAYLARRLSYSSTRQYLNIIRLMHLECGFPNPLENNWFLDSFLKGVAKMKGTKVKQKLPITPDLLLKIRQLLNLKSSTDATFWAVCLILFFSLLRKSNVLLQSESLFDDRKHLRRLDISLNPLGWRHGFILTIRWTKTLQQRERILECPLPLLYGHPLCPVTSVIQAFRLSPGVNPAGPAFIYHDNVTNTHSVLTYTKFIKKLHTLLDSLGYKSCDYAGHSFRRGGATWGLLQGLPGEMIKILGDWKSTCYLRYLMVPLSSKTSTIYSFAKNLPTYQ